MSNISSIESQLYNDLGLSRDLKPVDDGELGQEEFLELMVTQLRNQDPFSPMESGDFLGQIAQFGTVSGIGDLEKAFSDFSSKIFSNQALEAASLVGRDVLVPTDASYFYPAEGMSGSVELPTSANQVNVNIYSQTGQLVRTITLGSQDSGMQPFFWDGMNNQGGQMPAGAYRVEAEMRNGTSTSAVSTFINTTVQSVELGRNNGSMTLETDSLGSVDFSTVRRIG